MPEIIIDNREIEVVPGTKVIEAAEQLGIMVPRFCYHPALGPVGACRLCAVKCLEGPYKGVQMSCMIDAKDGMVVSTTDEEAADFRRHVIEWLMLNHPHDCPVCDEGGHCLLQDMTISGGHGTRRYPGLKRTYRDQYLGPLLEHEMNRCIHCYRCSRFYQEFAGYRDLGVMQSANRTYFGRYHDGILESPFSGNLSEICPTGVYTDKPSRFFGRRWDYRRSPSLCINCSLGCHTVTSTRYRQVVRQEARFSEAVNGYFICDRGRYGFSYASDEARPRLARLEGEEVAYDQVIRTAGEKLAQITKDAGPEAVACLNSGRSSLETQAMLKRVCQMKGWEAPSYFMDQSQAHKVKSAVSRLEPGLAVSLRQVEWADFIFVLGADPINEAPMLALAMRQAQRKGACVAVIDPRPISLPFGFQHLKARLDDLDSCLRLILKASIEGEVPSDLGQRALEFYRAIAGMEDSAYPRQEQVTDLGHRLRESKRPVVVCGTDIVRVSTPALAADCALLLQKMEKQAGVFYLLPSANAFGAELLSDQGSSFAQTLEAVENGTVRALILVETDPFWHFHDRERLELAIEKLEMLVVLDYLGSALTQKAHVFLPTATLYEVGGLFINQEGRLQGAPGAYLGGTPVAQISGGGHPPRVYGGDLRGQEPRAAWLVLAELATGKLEGDEEAARTALLDWLADVNPLFADVPALARLPEEGLRISPGYDGAPRFSPDGWAEPGRGGDSADSLELILTDWTCGTEELSVYSPHLRKVEKAPCLFVHTEDAARLGLTDGDRVAVTLGRSTLELSTCVVRNMAPGTVVLPRHRQLEWRKLKTVPTRVGFGQIVKAPD